MVEQATHLIDLARLLVGEGHVIAATAGRHERAEFPDASIADVSAALVRFDGDEFGGVSAVFTATCLLDGSAAVYLQLVCEGLLITITQEHVIYDTGRERRKVSTGADPAVIIDKAFLQAVREQNPLLLFSSYADALRTHRLCHDVLDAYR